MKQNLDRVSESDIQDLVKNGVQEGKKIEYKQELTINTDSEKKEFLSDFSSFANTVGGYLIYGMKENNGMPIELVGLKINDPDHEINKLENLIKNGIEPRIHNYEIKSIGLSNSKFAIIIKIGQSWISPHRVTLKGHDKFYSRTSIGKFPMDVPDLKTAFTLTETINEKIRNFRIDRISRISADDTPVLIYKGAKIVTHLIPLNSFSKKEYNLSNVERNPLILSNLMLMHCYRISHHYNFDGFLTFCYSKEESNSYIQLFRNGIIEATMVEYPNDEKNIRSIYNEENVVECISQYLKILKNLGVDTPILIFLTLTGVKGYKMPRNHLKYEREIDRDVLLLPNVILDDYENKIESLLKPIFDAVSNACGYNQSDIYDKNGKWKTDKIY